MEDISLILINGPVNIAQYNSDRNGPRWNSAVEKIYKKCLYDKVDPFNKDFRKDILDGLISFDKYIKCMECAKKDISTYGVEKFQALEPNTPITRIYDKLAFIVGRKKNSL